MRKTFALAGKAVVLALATTFAGAAAGAQGGYPNKPIHIIVPFPAGSSTDVIARVIGNKLNEKWGQPVIVENKPGAAGNIASKFVASSPADGYTLLMATVANPISVGYYKKLNYDFVKDLAPVTLVATAPLILVAPPSLPVNNIPELIDYAKHKPGALHYGTGGNGTSTHFTGEMFKNMTNTNIVHIPYKGATAALTDLLGGQIELAYDNLVGVLPYVQNGKLKAIAVTSAKRAPSVPNVPTVAETIPGFEALGWQGLNVPAGTPKDIVDKLYREIAAILHMPDVKAKLEDGGANLVASTPDEYAAFIRNEIEKWSTVAKKSNIYAE